MGPNQAPLYKFLKATKGGIRGEYRDNIKWNFAKFIIDREGVIIERFPPTTSPKVLEVGNMKDLHSQKKKKVLSLSLFPLSAYESLSTMIVNTSFFVRFVKFSIA